MPIETVARLCLVKMEGDEMLCRHIITNHCNNLNFDHLVAAARIAAEHYNPMVMIILREISKE